MPGRQREAGSGAKQQPRALADNRLMALHNPEILGFFLMGEIADYLILCKLLESHRIKQIFI